MPSIIRSGTAQQMEACPRRTPPRFWRNRWRRTTGTHRTGWTGSPWTSRWRARRCSTSTTARISPISALAGTSASSWTTPTICTGRRVPDWIIPSRKGPSPGTTAGAGRSSSRRMPRATGISRTSAPAATAWSSLTGPGPAAWKTLWTTPPWRSWPSVCSPPAAPPPPPPDPPEHAAGARRKRERRPPDRGPPFSTGLRPDQRRPFLRGCCTSSISSSSQPAPANLSITKST